MKLLFYLLFAIALFSCTQNELDKSGIPIANLNYQLLQGDWVSEKADSELEEFLSVEDSLCSGFYLWGEYVRYEISNDTLEIFKRYSESEVATYFMFRMKFEGKHQMHLKPLGKVTIDFFRQRGIESDSIVFHKVKSKNKIKPDKIKFYSSVCFGTCPSMYLEIDSNRKVKFFGIWNTELEGGYEGVLGEQLYNQLLDKIHNLPLDKIKNVNQTGIVDAQAVTLILEYDKKKIRCVFQAAEVRELGFIRHKLLEIYKFVNMKKTNLSIDDFDPELNNMQIQIPSKYPK